MKMPKINPLLLAFGVPTLMIIAIAASITLPFLFHKPQYDFLFTVGGYGGDEYTVQNGQLAQATAPPYSVPKQEAGELFRYRAATNTTEPLSFTEAQQLQIDRSSTSPDGFTVSTGWPSGTFLPFSRMNDYPALYLRYRSGSRKIPQAVSTPRGWATFIGWVK